MSSNALAILARAAVIVLLLLGFFQSKRSSTWIVWVPEGTHPSLMPKHINLDTVFDPWTKSLDVRVGGLNVRIARLTHRVPMAQWGQVCITADQREIDGYCPYKVPMTLVMDEEKTLAYVFGVMKRLHHLYGYQSSRVSVALGGTVTVEIPDYRIVLGRHHMLERLSLAYRALSDPQWSGHAGYLDMRYSDGFAWKDEKEVSSIG